MQDKYSFFMISGDPEKLYMGYITAIGYVSSGNKVYMFFTMDALKGVSKDSEKIVIGKEKPLKYYIDNLLELGEDDVEIAACEFGMKVKGIKEEDLLPKVKISGVSEFALKSSESKAILVF
ncbi:peroxiredoxin [Acidianus sulfidivorans JP7]|uniref:Peroxiredoxin n=2 Tax=Acidianus TaxID=12914 RepID=A0A2U9IPX2_9CREN|nr:DsrE family protein [Acidianus sulfidivorans]AWR98024.1 peroxiredoxin [Acidianus sulfidivorans JP7]